MSGRELTNVEIVVSAPYRLGGHERESHTGAVAFAAYQLAKDRFGWKLPQFRAKGSRSFFAEAHAIMPSDREIGVPAPD